MEIAPASVAADRGHGTGGMVSYAVSAYRGSPPQDGAGSLQRGRDLRARRGDDARGRRGGSLRQRLAHPARPAMRLLRGRAGRGARGAAQGRGRLERVMTIADLIRRSRGRAHAWRVEPNGRTGTLWHYSTPMLTWNVERPSDPDALDFDTGWGSVSDQNGMNTAFKVLGLP